MRLRLFAVLRHGIDFTVIEFLDGDFSDLDRIIKIFCEPNSGDTGNCLTWFGEIRDGIPFYCFKNSGFISVRRALFCRKNGPIKDKSKIHISCGNNLCLNLDHFDFVDSFKLKPSDIQKIKSSSMSCKGISSRYGVSDSYVSNIRSGRHR